jgi:hypothetical protein
MLHPITFSFPAEKMVMSIPPKKKKMSNLIPGKLNTYIYETEEDYYNEYKESYFAMTTRKGGWDCMRHYEILANGCIPYFPDLNLCPKNTLSLLPKNLLLEGNKLYNTFPSQLDKVSPETLNEYKVLLTEMLDYIKKYLTTSAMANYILEKANTSTKNISSILYLSGDTNPDYLRCITLHGFKQVFGSKCHDYPKIPHLYKSPTINYRGLYGKGITYTNLLEPNLHNEELDRSLEADLRTKKYDLIIYGSYHRGMPYYDLLSTLYNPDEIILLCGEDSHACDYSQWLAKGHHIFVRELYTI